MSELYIGVMSGTSLDGMDLILVEIGHPFFHSIKSFHHEPFQASFREEMLLALGGDAVDPSFLIRLHGALGHVLADAVERFLAQTGTAPQQIRALGLHGLTFRHCPEPRETLAGTGTGTLQLGDPHVISARTGIPVIYDFRHADMAVGGQGAPLAPFLDQLLFRHETKGRILLNLGGIANLTFLPANSQVICAFDSGPANMIIDSLMRKHPQTPGPFDPEGACASSGQTIQSLLDECLQHPYFAMKPPKSTGRKLFGDVFTRIFLDYTCQNYNDLVTTATRLTAISVAHAITSFAPQPFTSDHFHQLIVSGGGSHNQTLMAMIGQYLPIEISATSAHALDEDAKEALLMASLAWANCHRIPANIPAVTGASKLVVLGACCG